MIRRTFLRSLIAAPAIIRTPGLLMPVRAVKSDWSDWQRFGAAFDAELDRMHLERMRFYRSISGISIATGPALDRWAAIPPNINLPG